MKLFFKSKMYFVAFVIVFFAAFLPLSSISYAQNTSSDSAAESECFNLIQNKIPWKIYGSKNWSPQNVRNLCKNTTNPSAPGKCFQWALAADNALDWRKATKLCNGVNYYKQTLACYAREVNKQSNVEKIYSQCNKAGKTKYIIAPMKPVPAERVEVKKNTIKNYVMSHQSSCHPHQLSNVPLEYFQVDVIDHCQEI